MANIVLIIMSLTDDSQASFRKFQRLICNKSKFDIW